MRWPKSVLALVALVALVGCVNGGLVLGPADASVSPEDAAEEAAFGTPRLLVPRVGGYLGDPSLSDDELELFVTVDDDVWSARRAGIDQPFGEPSVVPSLSSSFTETDARLTQDALTIYLTSYREGGDGDIFVSTRPDRAPSTAWSPPRRVAGLSTSEPDCCVALVAVDEGFVTTQISGAADIYRAARTDGLWAITGPVDELNSSAHDQVDHARGGSLVVSSNRGGQRDIYLAHLEPASGRYRLEPIDAINTTGDERDGWLSADGRRLYFAREDGVYLAARP